MVLSSFENIQTYRVAFSQENEEFNKSVDCVVESLCLDAARDIVSKLALEGERAMPEQAQQVLHASHQTTRMCSHMVVV